MDVQTPWSKIAHAEVRNHAKLARVGVGRNQKGELKWKCHQGGEGRGGILVGRGGGWRVAGALNLGRRELPPTAIFSGQTRRPSRVLPLPPLSHLLYYGRETKRERDGPASGGGARTWQSPSLQACRRTGGLATMLSLLTGGRIEISAEGAQRRSSDGRSIACSSRGAAVVAQAPSPGRTRGLGGWAGGDWWEEESEGIGDAAAAAIGMRFDGRRTAPLPFFPSTDGGRRRGCGREERGGERARRPGIG
jgi:hypothetical protein